MPFLARRRVIVHAQNTRLGKDLFQFPHHFLRARARIVQMHAAAFGTGGEHMVRRAAVMAFECVFVAVIGERNVARLALGDVAAVAADDALRESAAVQK